MRRVLHRLLIRNASSIQHRLRSMVNPSFRRSTEIRTCAPGKSWSRVTKVDHLFSAGFPSFVVASFGREGKSRNLGPSGGMTSFSWFRGSMVVDGLSYERLPEQADKRIRGERERERDRDKMRTGTQSDLLWHNCVHENLSTTYKVSEEVV